MDSYYLDPLIDAYHNSGWQGDKMLFNESGSQLEKNFSDNFYLAWKEAVDNWELINNDPLIKDGKITSYILSIYEIIESYQTTKKVNHHLKNKDLYRNYLIENKDLYELMDLPGRFGRAQISLPLNEDDLNKRKLFTINENLFPKIWIAGDGLVTFYDFFEDIKREWKEYYSDAVKVIIRRESLKRFWGITDINDKGGYYSDYNRGDYNQFGDYSIRYFYLMPDGNLKGR